MRNRGYIVLFCSLLTLIVVAPFFSEAQLSGRLVFDVVMFAVIASALRTALGKRRRPRALLIVLAVSSVAGREIRHVVDAQWVEFATLGISLVFYTLITINVIGHVVRARSLTQDIVFGALCGYLMLGLVWFTAYTALAAADPAAFSFPASQSALAPFDLLYFSYVTLTTLGYGDIAPAVPLARSLALVESIVGQLYLVTLIARVVGLHIEHERHSSRAD